MRPSRPRVSVVIATYNRRELLLGCLEAVTCLDYPDYDVIVADDGSTDGSVEAARARFPQVCYLPHPTNTGEPAARNRGVRAAAGDVIAFTDDDCRPPRDWLRRHIRHYDDPRVMAAGGPQVSPQPNFFERFDAAQWTPRFERLIAVEGITHYAQHLITGNMSVRRALFADVGQFDEQLYFGCDSDFIRRVGRAGHRFVRDPSLRVDHLKRLDFAGYLHFRFRAGMGSVLIDVKEHRLSARRFVPLLNVVQTWSNWRYFARCHGSDPLTFARYWSLAVLTRAVEVSGRTYYYWTLGRRYRPPEDNLATDCDPG